MQLVSVGIYLPLRISLDPGTVCLSKYLRLSITLILGGAGEHRPVKCREEKLRAKCSPCKTALHGWLFPCFSRGRNSVIYFLYHIYLHQSWS